MNPNETEENKESPILIKKIDKISTESNEDNADEIEDIEELIFVNQIQIDS